MAILGDALRQAFMPKREYERLREEERAWGRLQRPLVTSAAAAVGFAVLVAVVVNLSIVFPREASQRPFCRDWKVLQALQLNVSQESELHRYRGAFYLTDQEAVDYYWMVVFVPSAVVFVVSVAYLVAGMAVAYAAPRRHPCLKVVENNFCASKRGGVRCLSILNVVFALIFGFMALFLGSSLLTMGNSCFIPLFWSYEIASWGLVILYGGTAFFLRRKAAVILDEGDYAGHNLGLEMLEPATEVSPEIERRLNEGFKAWMGSSLLSSDEEDGPDDYIEEGHPALADADQQRR
ncbi:unnamed protein product [Musa acuminata subsp. burmannicoides]|uniref:(wild Malaysian banana) hypothetical protein n=1 Tax=Musa acuminata subsp. malaccensis TaxID=214687 RepID=A0A804KWB3_MUSAM|nr:PREDICTED: uncharacterized protein LOC104000798 [Musa acuminata subsp. malaccensis]CAG1853561.1 unnamed protein product [Musa acuminata subsp. malaccensis]